MGRTSRNIPWLDRRDNQIYYVFWYDTLNRQTRRQSLHTAETTLAIRAYAEFLLKWSGGALHRPKTVSSVLDYYLNYRIDSETLDKQRPRIAIRYLRAYFDESSLRDVDVPACIAYAEARGAGKVRLRHSSYAARRGAPGTIRREITVLGAASRFALKRRFIEPEDMPSLEAPPAPPARTEYLTRQELKRVFESASTHLKDFIALAYYTGARRRAVEDLTWSQVEMSVGRINLLRSDADNLQRRSKKRRPVVPIDPQLRPVLERLATTLCGDQSRVLPPKDYYVAFKTLLTNLGWPEKRHPHILRHTRATHLLQDGVSIYDVARLLGDNPLTVEKVYGHHCADFLRETIGHRSFALMETADHDAV